MTPLEVEILTLVLKGHDTREKLAKALPGLQKSAIDGIVDSLITRGLLEARKRGLLRRESLKVTSMGLARLQGTHQVKQKKKVSRHTGPGRTQASRTVEHHYYYDDYYGYGRYHSFHDYEGDVEGEKEDDNGEDDRDEGLLERLKEEVSEAVDEVEEVVEDIVEEVEDEVEDDE